MAKVAIVKGLDPVDSTVKALEMVDAYRGIPKDKPILIKPNYLNASHPSKGITTDGRVVEGVVKYLKLHGFNSIIIGEGSGFADTLEAFKTAGLDVVAERWNVKLIDLNRDVFVEVEPPNPLALKKVKIAMTALESAIISVPKLKPHRQAGVTLSIKNMMGVMTPKGSMHIHLHRNIADLASTVKPCVAVIDGVIAGEGHESAGDPVKMDLVIAGLDPVAVDAVGAAVMMIPIEEVKHLRYAMEKGLGTCHLDQIEIVGEPIEKVKRRFRRSIFSKFLTHVG
ncbi:MAG: DUF362 domain-containing protein [Candidatus Bathyarchaeia archaeon]